MNDKEKYYERLIAQLSDDKYMGIEFFLAHILFAMWTLIVLGVLGWLFKW